MKLAMVILAATFAWSATAAAYPLVDRGIAAYEEAEFDDALEAFAEAEAATDLTRDDLETLYLTRALVRFASGESEAMEADLFRLALINPERNLGRAVAPRVRRAFRRIARTVDEPLALEMDISDTTEGVRIAAAVTGDDAALTQELAVYARAGRRWRRGVGELVIAPQDQPIRYYAEAIGAGGAVLVSEGRRQDPRTIDPSQLGGGTMHTQTRVRSTALDQYSDEEDDGGGGRGVVDPGNLGSSSGGGWSRRRFRCSLRQ